MEDFLPSELCTICHAAPPKYRCPRCSTRTCSLPCTTRHKKWAQCNGVRDPARFLKREELATPEGIDHDYNFLTSIERTFDRAEQDAERRGIEVQKQWRNSHRPLKGEIQIRAALDKCQVVVQRAPKGMTRRKQNKTLWHQKLNTLIWTVEWILKDGTSKIGSCPANIPIGKAYSSPFSNAEPAGKKGKRRRSRRAVSSSSDVSSKLINSPPLPSVDSFPHTTSAVTVKPQKSPTLIRPVVESLSPSPKLQPSAPKTLHFYLLHPGTPSPTRVLIPLSPDSTLASSLRHRVVLEFPTVYALRFAPHELPTGFITEEKYFRNREQKRINLVEATLHGNSPILEADDHAVDRSECFNAEQLLDVLKRDLGMRNEIRTF